jgi:hypothetical protein
MSRPVSVTVNNEPVEDGPLGSEPISAVLQTFQIRATSSRTNILLVPTKAPVQAVSIAAKGPAGPVGPAGPAGPEGPSGPPGGSYVFDQGSPATVWTIGHNLGKFPSVTVLDTAGDTVEGVIAYPDTNTVLLTFSNPFAGVAFLN